MIEVKPAQFQALRDHPLVTATQDLFGALTIHVHGIQEAWRSRRDDALNRGIPFEIEAADIERLFVAQGGRCDFSDVEFSRTPRFDNCFVKYPYAPSIDRRKPIVGYVPGNVRLVCVAANFGLGQWGDEVFLRLARGAVAKAGRGRL